MPARPLAQWRRRWRQTVARMRFLRRARLPVAPMRNVAAVWLVAATGLFLGLGLRLFAGNSPPWSSLWADVWQNSWRTEVARLGAGWPPAAPPAPGVPSWEEAALESALPGRTWSVEQVERSEERARSAGKKIAALTLAVLLGYSVDGDEGPPPAPPRPTSPGSDPPEAATLRAEAASSAAAPSDGEIEPGVPAEDRPPPSPLPPAGEADPLSGGGPSGAGEEEPSPPERTPEVRLEAPSPPRPEPAPISEDIPAAGEARSTMAPGRQGAPGGEEDLARPHRPVGENFAEPLLSPTGTCRVLIFHSHTSETYRDDQFHPDRPDEYHLWNSTESGIVRAGRTLARTLEEVYAVPTCHDTTIHDWPSHARAYVEARETAAEYLRRYPQIELVLDVHRDSPPDLIATVAGRAAARVAVVVGTHPTMHPGSATNVAVARHVERLVEEKFPGLFRRVIERPDARLNQDLHPRMILLEIGSYDTHLEAALHTARLLAEVVADTVYGIRTETLPGVGPPR